MAAPIKITRDDLDPAELRRAACRADSVAASRRMLALALVMEGTSRTEAAQAARRELALTVDVIVHTKLPELSFDP